MHRWYQDILPGTNLGIGAQINLRTLRLSGRAMMKILGSSCLASRYPLPPRSNRITGIERKLDLIYGAQWPTRKILGTKKFRCNCASYRSKLPHHLWQGNHETCLNSYARSDVTGRLWIFLALSDLWRNVSFPNCLPERTQGHTEGRLCMAYGKLETGN